MKVKIDIDCTAEEARAFLGLPDFRPLQEAAMKEMQDRMVAGLRSMDPEALFRAWMPSGLEGWEQFQKRFWQQFGSRDKDDNRDKGKGKGA